MQATNGTWSWTTYRAFQAVITKNMSHNFQLVSTIHRQWQTLNGTWNPTDPAKFIQPDAFANDKNIWRTDGLVDNNSLSTGNTLINNPMWEPYSLRFAGTYNAPWGLGISSSYTIVGGPWSGPVIDQIAANDPRLAAFGPSTVTSSTGAKQPNPLAHTDPLLLSNARRGPARAGSRPHRRAQGRQTVQVRERSSGGSGGERVQPLQRRDVLGVQPQRREQDL